MKIINKVEIKVNDNKNEKITVEEAGKKGGETTSHRYGHDFYEKIGHKGGTVGGKKGGQRVRELINEGKEKEMKNRS